MDKRQTRTARAIRRLARRIPNGIGARSDRLLTPRVIGTTISKSINIAKAAADIDNNKVDNDYVVSISSSISNNNIFRGGSVYYSRRQKPIASGAKNTDSPYNLQTMRR